MHERDAAQAEMLIQALCHLRDKMINEVNWLENQESCREAAAVRREIDEAQAHIVRLRRRYLSHRIPVPQPGQQGRQPRPIATSPPPLPFGV